MQNTIEPKGGLRLTQGGLGDGCLVDDAGVS